MKIFLIILCSLIFLYLVFSFIAAENIVRQTTHPKYSTREERTLRNIKHDFIKGTEAYKREPIVFVMRDGYKINGDISINNPQKFMIFAHGHGSTREGAYKYTKIFFDMGYSLILYDERGHGDNLRVPCTMGANESKDLAEIVVKIKEKYGNNIEIGVFGYSMGGATVCLASQYFNDDVKFIIVDCAYSSLRSQCLNISFTHHTPFFPTLVFVDLLLKVKYKFSFKDCDVKMAISRNKLPICFFHGKKDKTVFPIHSERLFRYSNSKIKELHIFENAGHSKCVEYDRNLYESYVKDFINKIGE